MLCKKRAGEKPANEKLSKINKITNKMKYLLLVPENSNFSNSIRKI